MKRIILFLFIAGLFYAGNTNAQAINNLRLTSTSLNQVPNFVSVGFVDSISITIFNDSTSGFNGTINIGYSIDSGTAQIADTSSGSLLYPTRNALESIPGRDSINRMLIITFSNPPFIIGTSAVVIWPIAQSNQTLISDSVAKTILVLPNAINEPEERNLNVYISNQQLVIQEDDQYLLKSVKLYDVAGTLMREQEISVSGTVNMEPYAAGVYLAEVNYADNTRRLIKVFNTK